MMDRQLERLWFIAQAHSYFPSNYANNFEVMKMCGAFAKAGARTTLVVPRRLSTRRKLKSMQESLWDFYGVPSNFEIAWLPFPYPVARFQRSMHALMVALYVVLKRIPFVYTTSEWVAIVLSRLGIPTVLEGHQRSRGPAQPMAARTACRHDHFVGLVCISKALAEEMIRLGFPSDKVMVAHDGVDLALFEPRLSRSEARAALKLPLNGKIVCHLGSLYRGRGIETLLMSAARLESTMFLMVGGNPGDIERYQSQVRKQNLDNVRFVGMVPNSNVPLYLYAADALVMAYTEETATYQYMSPMKMFEYMAAGRPIIASDFPVLHEVLRPEENALLVPPDDTAALTSAIQCVLSDSTLAHRLGRQALEDVSNYTWERRAERILNFIETRYDPA